MAVFVAVAETEGFTAGARRLGMPKATVSRNVARLEEELGTRLFHRTTRRVRLTPAGRRLLDRIGPHVAALTRVETGDLAPGPAGVLRITAAPDLGGSLLAEAVARMIRRHPQVQVETRLTLDVVDLVGEGFDLGIRGAGAQLPDSPHLRAVRIGELRMALFATPAYLADNGRPERLEDLEDHALVALSHSNIDDVLPAPRVRTGDSAFARALVLADVGIGLVPSFLVADDRRAGRVEPVLPDWSPWTGKLWLVRPDLPHTPPRVAAFREILEDVLATGALAVGA